MSEWTYENVALQKALSNLTKENVIGVVRVYQDVDADGAVTLVAKHGETITSTRLPAKLLREETNTVVRNAGAMLAWKSIILNRAVESIQSQDASTTLTILKRCANRAIGLRQRDSVMQMNLKEEEREEDNGDSNTLIC